LECAYEALENAGVPKEAVSGRNVGVFVGGNYSEHRVGNLRDLDYIPSFDATGNQGAFLAGRVAYYFNLHGPTFTVDTACSSSMHALHLAVQSIRAGESEQAIVGASHLITHPDIWVSMGKLRLFSDAGKTYAFDHRAKSGYARGEGAGCLVLKPLAQAQADNDHIFSVITHTGINHNGRTVGIVAPSQEEQGNLLRKVFTEASINPCDIGFFEAHGTGTKKGDPIEAGAIHHAVGRHFTAEEPLYIGSAKPNIGHLECASGVVSVIKAVLMLYYGFILPDADFERVNEAIPLEKWNMRVATGQKPWPGNRKYVCVNNFGFSGSNSTCVLRAAPQLRGLEVAASGCYSPLRLFVLSANDETALRNSVSKLGIWIEQHAELYQTTMPRNLAYTLCQRRSHLPWRVAVVAGMCSDVASALNSHEASPARAPSEPPRVAFVYTGQGAQWFAMGRELLRTHPVFFEAVVRADGTLWAIGADFSVLEELRRDEESSRLGLAHISQPICTAIQLALTDLFASFGVRPAAVTGHSSGEIAAAYAAGALTFESAMAAAYYRGQAIIELKETHPNLKGSMMAVGAGAEELKPMLKALNRKGGGPQAVVACENSPSSTTLSGDEAAIDRVGTMFTDKGVFNRKLFVDVAYHSPHMKLIAQSYFTSVRDIEAPAGMASSEVEFFSSLRGCRISLDELGPQYWVDNLTQAVRFSTSLQSLFAAYRPDILVEIGPHAALKGPIMQALKKLGPAATRVSYLPSLVRGHDATRTCLETAGQLFVRGYPLDFFEVNHHREENEKPELVPSLYTYPWSRQRYWYESRLSRQHRLKPFSRNDLLGTLADWSNDLEPTWRNVIRTDDLPWLKQYQVQSRMTFPVACFISMVAEAASQSASLNGLDAARLEIKKFRVSEHLFLTDGQEFEVLLNFRPLRTGSKRCHTFGIFSYEVSRGWLEHCRGTVTSTPVLESDGSASSSQAALNNQLEDVSSGVVSEASSGPGEASSDSASTLSKVSSSAGSQTGNGASTPDTLERNDGSKPKSRPAGCSRKVIYKRLSSRGMSYPSSFHSLVAVSAEGSEVAAQCIVRDTASDMPLKHETSYKLHPAVIDAMLQVPLLGPETKTEGGIETANIPCSIRHISLPSRWGQKTGDRFAIRAAAEPKTTSSMVELFTEQNLSAAISIAGLKFRRLKSVPRAAAAPRELCFKLNWEPLREAKPSAPGNANAAKGRAGVVIVTDGVERANDPVIAALSREIKKHTGVLAKICPLQDISDWTSHFIIMAEIWRPLLCAIDETSLGQVRKLLTEAPGLMWVTRGAARFPTAPNLNMAIGLVRTARSERSAIASTLDLDPHSELNIAAQVALIGDAFAMSVLAENEEAEMEFAEDDGKLVVPRIVPDEKVNLEVHRSLGPSAPYRQNFHQPGRRLRLASRADSASGDGLYFEDVTDRRLGKDEIEIVVAASALSHDDIITGTADKTNTAIPRSCSGTVTRIGRDAWGFHAGDRVCALAEGAFGTHARAKATSVAVIPTSIGMEAAACIPGPLLSAYYALKNIAKVKKGERVLVQLTGPAGVAAVEVAKCLRASVYALVQNDEQTAVAEAAGVTPDRIFDARSIYLGQELEEATHGEGMEVVLALSGYENVRAWECLANFGRFVEIRTPGDHDKTRPELGVNATFSSIDMVSIAAERPAAMELSLQEIIAKIKSGAIIPPTAAAVVPVSALSYGIRLVRDSAVESIVAVAGKKEQVQVSGHEPGVGERRC
jgi:acyl transferase domain-containing protein/NADPH:quinone reductase-like Zn-dependent oxidoreductase